MVMFRKDNNAHFFEYKHYNDAHRYGFRSGKISIIGEISVEKYKSIMQAQKEWPVSVMHSDSKVWWIFQDEIYWENDNLDSETVKTLILATQIRKKQKIERDIEKAKSTIAQVANLKSDNRQPIPDDVKMFVWQRDNGRCVKCGSNKSLEFDHIIPFSQGGSNTARNLQILCETCNRSKGGNLF
jgi:5-methylcytosine-specific restriction endonuclease McrA